MTTISPLMALSPLDGRYQTKCQSLATMCSEYGLTRYRLFIEIQWLIHIGTTKEIVQGNILTTDMQKKCLAVFDHFDESACQRVKEFEMTTNHDVKAVEYYLKEQLSSDPAFTPFLELIHFACTSEDINNLSYALMLRDLRQQVIVPQLQNIQSTLKTIALEHKALPMLSRTHGQSASPTTLGKELANVWYRIQRQLTQLNHIEVLGKINGAVGNFNAHCVAAPNVDWLKLSKDFVQKLGLTFNPMTTQIDPHDFQAEFYHVISRINTIYIDFARDIWGYISNHYFKQKLKEGEVGSSTMPHKVNPIDFENAEGNFGISNALLTHLSEKLPISRWQRDLSDSTVQRNIGSAIGYHVLAMQSLKKGLSKLEVNTQVISEDLAKHTEVLAEAIQTVMRQHQVPNAYELLKTFTRGKDITPTSLQQFISELDLPEAVKARLSQLSPANYIGLAAELTEQCLNHTFGEAQSF